MRILGGILIVLGLLFSLSIVGAVIGIPMMILGIVLVALGARQTVITNVVSVQAAPAPRVELGSNASEQESHVGDQRRTPLPRQPRLEATPTSPIGYDQSKWQVLIRYDDEIRSAAERVRPFGAAYEAELAMAYLQVNDKTYLEPIVKRIIQEAGTRTG